MKTRIIELNISVLLCWSLSFSTVAADEKPPAHNVPLSSMNQAEFEMYHQQLDLKVKGVTSVKPMPDAATRNQAPIVSGENGADRIEGKQHHDGGYGKGYGARMGPGNNAGGGNLRGGSMGLGGGRNR